MLCGIRFWPTKKLTTDTSVDEIPYLVDACVVRCHSTVGRHLRQRLVVPTKSPQPYPGMGGDFTLSAISGPVALSDFEGKAVLIFFGYTHCPDVCPTDLARMGQVLNALTPAEKAGVRSLFISIDPERDTPQRIADYARFFHPSIIGLTGTPDDIYRIAKQYLVLYQKAETGESQAGYLMDHSTKTYLIGRDGHLEQVLGHELEASQVLAAVRDALMRDA